MQEEEDPFEKVVEIAKQSIKSAADFIVQDDHKRHEYKFCERTLMNAIRFLMSHRGFEDGE